ncbi:Crp/Fnr family transcriptional regulator [Halobacteriovorax sp.]|uniref:Crp/Fnr family transcriptional regulator n=1 Tax=Halobacteriovorax sp. TaxID=2020862 RepID=UPI0035624385
MKYQKIKPFIKHSTSRNYKRGEIIYSQDSTPTSIYFIESGTVGLFHNSSNGKEVFLRVFGEDSIFGHRSYFANSPYHANSMALRDTNIIIISNEECQRICKEHPELLMEMVSHLAKDLGQAELRLAGVHDKSVAQRVSESLVFLKLKYPDQVWTRKEIADFSVTTFESVARVMTLLAENNIIKKDGRDFIINDLDKLINFNI